MSQDIERVSQSRKENRHHCNVSSVVMGYKQQYVIMFSGEPQAKNETVGKVQKSGKVPLVKERAKGMRLNLSLSLADIRQAWHCHADSRIGNFTSSCLVDVIELVLLYKRHCWG